MSSLTLAADFGGSHLRGFFTLETFKPELILMEPEVALVPLQSLDLYEQSKVGYTSPKNSAWIQYKGKHHAVGFLARKRFHADLQLQKRKFELAIPKVLAMVGVLSQEYDLPNGSDIRLATVFPWGEYQDRALFKQILTEALADYSFKGQPKAFGLETFICLPEGGGVLTRGRPPGSSLKEQKIIVLMLGYRDASILLVERGEMSWGRTERLGFAKMIESVMSRTSGLNQHQLISAICKAGKNVNPKALLELTQLLDTDYKDHELFVIRQAIQQAREEYWAMLSQWLKLHIPPDIDELILAGGTANFLRPELNTLFSYTKMNWCEELEKQITNNFASQVTSKSLNYRLTDVYGLFFYLCGNTAKQKVKSDV